MGTLINSALKEEDELTDYEELKEHDELAEHGKLYQDQLRRKGTGKVPDTFEGIRNWIY